MRCEGSDVVEIELPKDNFSRSGGGAFTWTETWLTSMAARPSIGWAAPAAGGAL